MSDGMSDAAALGGLERAVEARSGDLARALWAALAGHRGQALPDAIEIANEVLRLHGLELVASPDFADKIERSARLLRW